MRRHPLDVFALVLGLLALCAAGGWALWWFDVVDADAAGWLVPASLVGVGAVGLVASTRPAPPEPDDPTG